MARMSPDPFMVSILTDASAPDDVALAHVYDAQPDDAFLLGGDQVRPPLEFLRYCKLEASCCWAPFGHYPNSREVVTTVIPWLSLQAEKICGRWHGSTWGCRVQKPLDGETTL